ncbi:tetratricopeptide repeat protein [Humidesulfovibrio sp.]|jgi:tetratricopeptide (TPR) repeat protein
MRQHPISTLLCCVLFLAVTAAPISAQDLPQECRQALEVRSPQGQIDLFTRCLDTGRVNGESKATTLKQRAVAYMHLGQHKRAIEDINQAVKLRPDDADNYYLRGFSYRALNDNERAVEDCNRAINLDRNFAAAYATRAFAHKSLGNLSQARSDAQRALLLDSSVKVPSF